MQTNEIIQRNIVFVAGATGFLGAHIARKFVENGYNVIALKRDTSDLSRCRDFKDKVVWISTDDTDWMKTVVLYQPKVIINAAWEGVSTLNRDNWATQINNLHFARQLLNLAAGCSVTKYIGLGSQAEYGCFSEKVSEEYLCRPMSAYGTLKFTCSDMTRIICDENLIKWYWLRLFSVFGEGESEQWLIPSLIKRMLNERSMDFTACEQQYDYLYVGDIADAIVKLSEKDAPSGCYNLCSSIPHTLKEIVKALRARINPEFHLDFDRIPYRPNQSMYMIGDNSKFVKSVDKINVSDFWEKFYKTADYYISN